jgi:Ppx/GppA phosphatase family
MAINFVVRRVGNKPSCGNLLGLPIWSVVWRVHASFDRFDARPGLRLACLGVLGLVLIACGRQPAPAAPAATAAPPAAAAKPPAVSCRPDLADAIPAPSGQQIRCVIDVGSRNVKLVVLGVKPGDAGSLQNLRQCRARLQLGDKSFDPATGRGRPLPRGEQDRLVEIIQAYRQRCDLDGGQLVGAIATEWARRASNASEVVQQVGSRSGVTMAVVSREDEARYGYLSGTRGKPGKLVLDFGSRSLQLSFWARDARSPEVVSVPLGIDEAGDRFFGGKDVDGYQDGQRAAAAALRSALRPALARARSALRRKVLDPELHSLGENGDLALAASARLWPGQPPVAVDEAGYTAEVKRLQPHFDVTHGRVTAVLPARQMVGLAGLLSRDRALFDSLRSERLRRVFGNKMLVFPTLIALLEQELGLRTLVLVPQEMADGYLIASLEPKR